MQDGDTVIFMNFRPDRAREISRCFVDEDFTDIQRRTGFLSVDFVCTTEYDATLPNVTVAYPHQKLVNTFGEYISKLGLTQLRIAETEKYAHVTFFFNGGVEEVFPGEDRCLIPSPKVATYDLQPEMSAYQVTEEAVKRIESGAYDVVILNFANCDMVGHTGVYDAACKAVSTVDECVNRVVEATSKMGGERRRAAEDGASGTDMSEAGGAGSKGAGGGASLGGGTASGFTSGVPPERRFSTWAVLLLRLFLPAITHPSRAHPDGSCGERRRRPAHHTDTHNPGRAWSGESNLRC